MEDINNYIKENDTDNVILNKLKELGTKLTGQENVQGETIADVLDFINSNYSGGGSGSTFVYYNVSETDIAYAYKDKDFTQKFSKEELMNAFINGLMIRVEIEGTIMLWSLLTYLDMGNFAIVDTYNHDNNRKIELYSSEYTQSEAP